MGSSKFKGLSQFDAYAKTLDDFRIKTSAGGTVTLISTCIIFILAFSEFMEFISVSTKSELSVDKSRTESLPIFFDITFPKIPCHLLSLDSIQATGDYQINLASDINKTRLDKSGLEITTEKFDPDLTSKKVEEIKKKMAEPKYCGSCYGSKPATECCNTCDAVKSAYIAKGWDIDSAESIEQCVAVGWTNKASQQKGEGCNLHGQLIVKKIPGAFHIALGESINFMGLHMHATSGSTVYDYSHTINKLSFGSEDYGNSLQNTIKKRAPGPVKYQYFLNVVATNVKKTNGEVLETYQYSATQHEQDIKENEESTLPGIFFNFKISPMLITLTHQRKSFTGFLTSLCAIVGGIITVAGLVDSVIYNAERTLRQKVDLGKAS